MHATPEDVGLVLRHKRDALVTARRQIDNGTTGRQARAILDELIEELDHDLKTMKANPAVVAALAAELGISLVPVPVTEASLPTGFGS